MSLLNSLINSLTGSSNEDFTPPHALCPGKCELAPASCEKCLPYKQQLNDALYNIDHLEEFLARYEVGAVAATGSTECPHCGAPSADPFVCEYCGLQIQPDDGKIRVASANDIPDPILEARDIIYERQSAIVAPAKEAQSGGGLLSGLLDLLSGGTEEGLGARMSKQEIQEAAEAYSVSVSTYLNGLDNGTYLTLEKKKEADAAAVHTATGAGLGLAGGAVLGGVFSNASQAQRPPQRPPMQQPQSVHQANRPAQQRPQTLNQQRPPQQPRQSFSLPQQGGQSFNRVEHAQRPQQTQQKPQQQAQKTAKVPEAPHSQGSGAKGKEHGGPAKGGNSINKIKR